MMDPMKTNNLAPASSSKVSKGLTKLSHMELSKQASKGKLETPKANFLAMKNLKSAD